MTDTLLCPRCSSATQPDQLFCWKCGAPLAANDAGGDAPGDAAPVRRPRARGSKDEATAPAQTKTADIAADIPADIPSDSAVREIDPRLAALGLDPDAAPPSAPVRVPAPPYVEPAPATPPPTEAAPTAKLVEPEPEPDPELEPVVDAEPVIEQPARIPGGYLPPTIAPEDAPWTLRPSSTSSAARPLGPSVGINIGATPVSPLDMERPDDEEPVRTPAPAAWPIQPDVRSGPPPNPATTPPSTFTPPSAYGPPPTFGPRPTFGPPPAASPVAAQPAPFLSEPPLRQPSPFAAPVAPVLGTVLEAPAAPVAATPPEVAEKPARTESIQELVTFGLVAGGAVVGIAGLVLPWANADGFGVGNIYNNNLQPNQWGLGMPASPFLFLLSALVLVAASGSDRAKERLPNLASVIGQVTDLMMPMILGGVYLGAFLLYLTLPSGFGIGVWTMLLGGCLLVAGAVVNLFFPPTGSVDPQ